MNNLLVAIVVLSLGLTVAQEHRPKELQTEADGYFGDGDDNEALHGSYGCHELQDISIEIYVAHGQVEMTMQGPQGEWFGFGFGSYRMEGTYAIIASEGGVSDYFLSKSSVTGDQTDTKIDEATSCLTVISDESDGFYRTIRIQRPRDHPETFSFPSNVGNYPIISAKAVYKTHEMSYHGLNRRLDHFDFLRVGNYAHSRSGSGSWSHSGSGSGSWSHSGSGSGSWSHSGSGSGSWSHSGSGSGSHSAEGSHSGLFHHPHYDHPPEGKYGSHSISGSGSHSFSASGSHSFSASGSGSGSHSYSESGETSHPWGEGCCVSNDDADVRGRYQGDVFHPLKCHEAYDREICISLMSAGGADRCLWKHGPECYEEAHREVVMADEQWQGPKGECVWSGQGQPLTALSDAAKWDAQCSALSEAECVTGGPYTHCLWVGFAHLADLDVAATAKSFSFGCVWDETGAGDSQRMSAQCERLSESECMASQSNNKDARCAWKALSHLNSQAEAAQLMDARRGVSTAAASVDLSTMDVVLAVLVLLTLVVVVVRVCTWSKGAGYVKVAPELEPLLETEV